MRPWTLKHEDSTRLNPLLSVLGKCVITTEADIPVWTQLPDIAEHIKHTAAGQDSSTHTSGELSECYKDNNYDIQISTTGNAEQDREIKRRRRSKSKPDSTKTSDRNKISYATSWGVYIDGNVVSVMSRRLIVNLLAATAATQAEKQNDSSEDENE